MSFSSPTVTCGSRSAAYHLYRKGSARKRSDHISCSQDSELVNIGAKVTVRITSVATRNCGLAACTNEKQTFHNSALLLYPFRLTSMDVAPDPKSAP